ncbi:MAG: LexA family protein [Flavisolibacter sp.]
MDYNIFSVPSLAPAPPDAVGYENSIDLNEKLVRNRATTYFLKVNSQSMMDAGILQGDVVIVDRSLEPENGKVVIVLLDGEMLIRRLEIHNHKKRLLPATSKLAPIEISEGSMFVIWGVVTYVIHNV